MEGPALGRLLEELSSDCGSLLSESGPESVLTAVPAHREPQLPPLPQGLLGRLMPHSRTFFHQPAQSPRIWHKAGPGPSGLDDPASLSLLPQFISDHTPTCIFLKQPLQHLAALLQGFL